MTLTIKEQSAALQTAAALRLPAEVSEVFARHRDALVARGTRSDVVGAGDVVEDFILPDANGRPLSLSELVADGPAVLVFYRGAWCPFCNLALRHYQTQLVPELERHGATLAAISPQKPDESLSTAEKHSLQFPVLSDTGGRLARKLGLAFQPVAEVLEAQRALGLDISEGNADGSTELPMPTVLIVDRDRVVRFADVRPDYTSRTEVPTILSALAALGPRPPRAEGGS